jgi:acetyl esterase/lipase
MNQQIKEVLNAKYYVCQHCGRPIRFLDRVEKCAYSLEQICSRCSVNERFSEKVADQIPPEFHEKFRFYTLLQWVLGAAVVFGIIGTAWWGFTGWEGPDVFDILISAAIAIGKVLLALIIALFLAKQPRWGAWLFYWWVLKPANRARMDAAIAAYAKGEYQSSDPIYRFKQQILTALKRNKLKILFISAIGVNVAMIPLFFIIRSDYTLAGTPFSVFGGVVYAIDLIVNLLLLWTAAAFYSRKDPINRKNRIILETGSWLYMILVPIAFLTFIIGHVLNYELWDGELELGSDRIYLFTRDQIPQVMNGLFATHQIILTLVWVMMVGLAIFLLRLEPNFEWRRNEENAVKITKPGWNIVVQLIRTFGKALFLVVFVAIFVITMELLFVDFAMAICVISYYLVIIFLFVIFALIKILPKAPILPIFKYRLNYTTFLKISAVIVIINFLPMSLTVGVTNPDLDRQFTAIYGEDWQEKVKNSDTYPFMRQVKFSFFDAYFGYEVPVNARYEMVYMHSSPRYVRDRATGEILSNGSSPYTNITHDMIFDAYLPARPEFGNITFDDGKPKKFPVLIFMHGVGMDRGSGNANWTSQYFANLGYAVFDMSYGFTGWADYPYTGGKERGYDYVDTILHIAEFTKFLELHADEYHADLSNVFVAGRSFGGWMTLNVAYLANTTYAGGNYSSQVKIRGAIPYYPASDLPTFGSDLFDLALEMDWIDAPYIRGSSNPDDPDFNPDWLYFNPKWMAENIPVGGLPATFAIQGTHDYLVPAGASRRLQEYLSEAGHPVIAGFYPFGSHGFDALHWSPYGQSILYYMERFMALNTVTA